MASNTAGLAFACTTDGLSGHSCRTCKARRQNTSRGAQPGCKLPRRLHFASNTGTVSDCSGPHGPCAHAPWHPSERRRRRRSARASRRPGNRRSTAGSRPARLRRTRFCSPPRKRARTEGGHGTARCGTGRSATHPKYSATTNRNSSVAGPRVRGEWHTRARHGGSASRSLGVVQIHPPEISRQWPPA